MPSTATKLLIVDDESLIRALLAQIFRQRGHEVRTARDGFDALRKLREWTPDVLISDLNMPGMSGFELLSVVRRRLAAMYVVASSGAYTGTDVPDGIMADAFHTKGRGIQTLVDMVEVIAWTRPLQERRSRDCMPIWVERCDDAGLDREAGAAYAMISCPECLRALPQLLHQETKQLRETECRYCMTPVQFAVVQEMQPVLPLSSAAR